MNPIRYHRFTSGLLLLAGLVAAGPASARVQPGDPEYESLQSLQHELAVRAGIEPDSTGRRHATTAAIPDIFGPGQVLTVGNVDMKVTNYGLVGNPFTNVSSDPSGQWPGASGVEYLNFLGLAVGAVNPFATDPNAIRRVSYLTEWRPPSLDPVDRIYRAYDGIVNGQRFINDDGDHNPDGSQRIDEDFLDGHDNDGDGKIDEDYAAIGQEMFTCVIRDDTPQAIQQAQAERHVPLGISANQSAWAYSIPGFTNFNVIEWDLTNVSGHELDSVAIGFRVDLDVGPIEKSNFFSDDFDVPMFPFGHFVIQTPSTDGRLQPASDRPKVPDASDDSSLCSSYIVTVNGFSAADDDGDQGKTTGVPSMLLIDHSIDPTGENGPRKVGFRSFRSFPGGTPYNQGGNPTIDQQRFEFMTAKENVMTDGSDPKLQGFINKAPGDQKGDYSMFASIGPWLHWPAGGQLSATVAFAVNTGDYKHSLQYVKDYEAAAIKVKTDPISGEDIYAVTEGGDLLGKYPVLQNALSAQVAFEGAYEQRAWPLLTDFPGRETPVKAPPGQVLQLQGCPTRDLSARFVNDRDYTWFDFDCDYCTGAYSTRKGGLFHHTWLAEAPPPSPNTNMSAGYNYTDNPERRFPPGGDGKVTVAWDNLSETTPDPKTGQFDFRGYKVWKVSNWQRPVGAGGPGEDDWTLLAEYRYFNFAAHNYTVDTTTGQKVCPQVFIPALGTTKPVCLDSLDLWNQQTGDVIKPDTTVGCITDPVTGQCVTVTANKLGLAQLETRTKYDIGRYRYVDTQVHDGFVYFYSVSAFDSTGQGAAAVELNSRRSAVEADGVVPQASTGTGKGVWVVPNPYRGVHTINDRPSAWDLTPNATDPTGTHIDFFGMPRGAWTIRIYTVSGDLVQTLHSTDEVNESIRNPVTDTKGNTHPGYNRQQDTPNDGEARWNLITRSGQDVVSGIYLFTVESSQGTQRGKFVVIR